MKSAGSVAVAMLFVLAGMSGCGVDQGPDEGLAKVESELVPMLPAWKLPTKAKIPGKADYADDHPEYFAITEAPSKQGFRFFTEWQDKQAWLLGYPGSMTQAVENTMSAIVKGAVDYVDFYVVVPGSSAQNSFINELQKGGVSQSQINNHVHFIQVGAVDSIWMIDSGPFPLVAPDDTVAFTDFRYYPNRLYDDAVPTKVGMLWGLTVYRGDLYFEGGNIQMDEVGTCYHSQGAFWENPDKSEAEVHQVFADYLGCKTFVVLQPLQDGTSHMDMFSKLASKNQFVLGECTTSNCSSTTVNTLESDKAILNAAVLADGTKLNVHRIPMPYQKDGVWRTFTNSTLANKMHLYPNYSQWKDLEAEAVAGFQAAMPGWTHVGINSDTIISWGGAIHCISRTVPTGSYTKWIADGNCVGGNCQAPAGGYSGSCSSDDDCQGPEWLGSTPSTCGDLTYEGCCDGDLLKWCENSQVQSQNCQSGTCGWSANQQFYNCGTSGSEDPSGQFPKDCNGCQADCTGKECGGDGCGGSCGSCASGESCNAAGQCVGCTPDCAGKECGGDGCGGSCGSCPTGETCGANGLCGAGPVGCNGLGYEGCCDGVILTWCENDEIQTIDCGQNGAPYDTCGWSAGDGYYNCGQTGAEPTGTYPIDCPGSCTADCTGKECGGDGCGGSCGTCPQDSSCNASGQCIGCTPDCTGKACGDDGCGGSCGACGANETCQGGQCVGQTDPCDGISFEGCCDGEMLQWCENDQVNQMDCDQQGPKCGWDAGNSFYNCGTQGEAEPTGLHPKDCPGPCVPDCAGKECGDDGCGAACGTCATGETCDNFQCVGCQPDCANKACGDDGCGGSCGACATGEKCDNFQCVGCQSDCTGKACGDDGCGGSCGACATGETCDNFQCVGCQPDCTGKACGDDGCGSSCGDCPNDTPFCVSGVCVKDCNPDCTGRECGDNGCGGSCGKCGIGEQCVSGVCQGQVIPDSNPTGDTACTPDCIGRTCGPNGCGGTCGNCPIGFACNVQGQCMAQGPKTDSGSPDAGPVADAGGENKPGGNCSVAGNAPAGKTGFAYLLFGLLAIAATLRPRRSRD